MSKHAEKDVALAFGGAAPGGAGGAGVPGKAGAEETDAAAARAAAPLAGAGGEDLFPVVTPPPDTRHDATEGRESRALLVSPATVEFYLYVVVSATTTRRHRRTVATTTTRRNGWHLLFRHVGTTLFAALDMHGKTSTAFVMGLLLYSILVYQGDYTSY